ncbi:MAG: amidohydrolase family protein [Candidatus Omnitrophota bacterium]
MIIDAHSHWLPEEIINCAHFFSKAWGNIESQIRAMEEAGVDRAVLSYPTTDAHMRLGSLKSAAEIYNERVGAILKKYPDKFIGAAVLPVDDSRLMLEEYQRAVEGLGFRALSLATSHQGIFLDDASYFELYARAEKQGIPVFVHSQIVKPIGFSQVDDPLLTPVIEYVFETTMCVGKLLMAGVFERFKKLPFIFAYFGGVTPFLIHRYDATYRMLREIDFVKDLKGLPSEHLKNIYVDTGGDKTLANYLSSLELVGPKHMVWGSDYPAKKNIKESMEVLERLPITQEDRRDILGENLVRIFHL